MWNYMSVGKRDNLTRFQTFLALSTLNGMVKTKLAILPILYCEEIVKNSSWPVVPVLKVCVCGRNSGIDLQH